MKALLLLLASLTAAPAFASAELAAKKNCLGCHSVERKIVGPAFKDVAARYAGRQDMVAALAEKIRKGGAGVWGANPMPANAVTPEEARTLAAWVLARK